MTSDISVTSTKSVERDGKYNVQNLGSVNHALQGLGIPRCFLRVMHDGPIKRETTRSLVRSCQAKFRDPDIDQVKT